ncbi:MAG: hypothetical protein CMP99_06910 [Gammaproteobacteria bacterium]|nr:hypothetical protein [Gammaproteobacteria bacterium]
MSAPATRAGCSPVVIASKAQWALELGDLAEPQNLGNVGLLPSVESSLMPGLHAHRGEISIGGPNKRHNAGAVLVPRQDA